MTHVTHTQQALFAPFVDEQAVAQAELERHIEQLAQAIAPEELKVVEINFYEHEIFALDKLVAKITYDHDDFQTQRWIVMVNEASVHRANTWLKCHSYITWHYMRGELPVQEPSGTAAPVYEVMAEIAAACEEFGFDSTGDGIYDNSVKLGSVGCTDGRWWVAQASNEHQIKVPCDCAFDGVWLLSMVSASPNIDADQKPVCFEELLDKPFELLTPQEWATMTRVFATKSESVDNTAAPVKRVWGEGGVWGERGVWEVWGVWGVWGVWEVWVRTHRSSKMILLLSKAAFVRRAA